MKPGEPIEAAGPVRPDSLRPYLERIIAETPVLDVHTHLYPSSFRKLSLWGIDELITYHYLIAELFRSASLKPSDFWNLPKTRQADLIWETLFIRNTPLSEAARGIVAVLQAFGLNPNASSLQEARDFFASRDPEAHLRATLALAGVSEVVMTNDVFDEAEASYWEQLPGPHPLFHAVLRMDPLLNTWEKARRLLETRGYAADSEISAGAIREVRRFIEDGIARLSPIYLAVSLPPDFRFPEDSPRGRLLAEAVLPVCREHDLPFAMMIGVRKLANPALRDAGDSVGHADIRAVERICLDYPENRFLVTMLSRENQHELCVASRKFANLMPFGCWWFLNNPSIVSEITNERIELLGSSFIPQHSDARILEQVIYKWAHSRQVIADSLESAYRALMGDGWQLTGSQISRDVNRMFQDNFRRWTNLLPRPSL